MAPNILTWLLDIEQSIDEIIWTIISRELPKLKIEVHNYLQL